MANKFLSVYQKVKNYSKIPSNHKGTYDKNNTWEALACLRQMPIRPIPEPTCLHIINKTVQSLSPSEISNYHIHVIEISK